MKKWSSIVSLIMVFLLLFGGVASAFDDLPEGSDRDKIRSLKERGIVNGYGHSYMGQKKMTNAEAVHLIVKAFDLNLAAHTFIKQPVASDSFDKIPNDAWYAESFVNAFHNKLELPRSIDPKAEMTREVFAHHVLTALLQKGDFAFTKRFYNFADEEQVDPNYRGSLQVLLNGRILKLEPEEKFRPKDAVTRREAAVLVYDALEFVKAHTKPIPPDGISVDDKVTMTSVKVSDDVNKITLLWGEKPNGGYTLTITKITFDKADTATVHYKLGYPQPDQMYTQAIVTPSAQTFISSQLKVELAQEK